MEYKHVTKEGVEMSLIDMTDSHLLNMIRLIERKAKEGIEVFTGGGGPSHEDFWIDHYVIYGIEAKEAMHYSEYVEELKSRQV